jgi:hypothetical protein
MAAMKIRQPFRSSIRLQNIPAPAWRPLPLRPNRAEQGDDHFLRFLRREAFAIFLRAFDSSPDFWV